MKNKQNIEHQIIKVLNNYNSGKSEYGLRHCFQIIKITTYSNLKR
ncbi:hypothetical protein BH23BAC2_BH23BAC2_00130 [soil metagenome]